MWVCICHAIREAEVNSSSVSKVRAEAKQTGCAKCLKHIEEVVSNARE